MVRGIVSGLVWGGVVASAGLVVVSQIAPLPQTTANAPAATETVAGAEDDTAGAGAGSKLVADAPESGSTAPAAASGLTPTQPSEAAAPAPEATDAAPSAQSPADAESSAAGGATQSQTPDPAESPAAAADTSSEPAPEGIDPTAPDAPKAPAAPGLPPAPVAGTEAAPGTPTAPPPADRLALADAPLQPVDLPPPPPRPPLDEALLAPLAEEPPTDRQVADGAADGSGAPLEPEDQAPADDAARAPLPQVGEEPPPADAAPAPSGTPGVEAEPSDAPALPGKAAGSLPPTDPAISTDRLPRIGDAEPLPDVEVLPEEEAPLRPIEAFARPFDNPDGKPLFAILLADDGAADLDRQALAALPFPVTFVLDPLSPKAAEAAAIYRAGMKEVVFAASGLPAGATAADAEQTFQSHALTLPETVGVIDLPEGGFQDDRTLAAAVLPILAEQGRGLLTYDRGLNAADQIARREGIPSATIFRRLDAEGESTPTMRRYLDRAAFRAAQEGEVVVIGSTRPETVAALLEWTVEGRAASVALAPVSAVLTRP